MMRYEKTPWHASLLLVLLVFALPLACGGGGGNRVDPPGLSVSWSPANPNPGANTISLGATSPVGANFSVPVNATDINDFFGAAFRVDFDPATAAFSGFSPAGSIIDTGGGVTVLINAVGGAPGEVLVNATRQQGAGGVYVPGVDVTGSQLLLTLNFRATQETAGANSFSFSSHEVQTCNDATETCAPLAGVTWSGGSMTAR